MAASALIRGAPLLRLRLQHHHRFATGLLVPLRRSWCSTAESTPPEEDGVSLSTPAALSLRKAPKYSSWDDQNYRQWKDEEADIWRDIEPITHLAKEIIHSDRYMDGEQLTDEDEKVVAERLLAYHPNSDDKIGCGLDSIMPVYNVLIQTIYFEGVNLVRMNVIYKVVFAKSLSDGSVHRYMDGEQLTAEDEKVVAGRLLVYRPNSNDKIGCLNGVDATGQIVFNPNIETDSKRAHLFHEEINGPIEVPMAQYKLSNHPLLDPKMAASALLSQLLRLRLRLRLHQHHRLATGLLVPLRRSWCSTADYIRMEEDDISVLIDTVSSLCEAAKYSSWEEQNYRQWKDEEAEIWRDIEPITHLAKEILHSNRYKDGEQLTDEDEKAVAGRLLVYHPNCDDKVGCGLDSIAVICLILLRQTSAGMSCDPKFLGVNMVRMNVIYKVVFVESLLDGSVHRYFRVTLSALSKTPDSILSRELFPSLNESRICHGDCP
ncbi:hypothetical protein POTOM_047562 [Populus tomentosa]|uniref:Uncharacterized protein n=1 Tax=Populus tomentosa TaxID=118781 RepID=A0A8X7YDR9_POPTO|nr:hypothetical protein POTOM_047562 [Populus tomentosa]